MSKTFKDYLRVQQPRAEPECVDGILKCRFSIAKADADKREIFGWASVATRADGDVIKDWQDDVVEIGELESAAYDYVLNSRDGGEMHKRGGVATLIESMVFTKTKQQALGIQPGTVPEGWWIGMRVEDEDVWNKIKSGEYSMFSIEGNAVRQHIE